MFDELTMIALIMAIAQVLKNYIPNKMIPLTNMLFGVLAGFYCVGISIDGAVTGIAMGLSACGVYDFGAKTLLGNNDKTPEELENATGYEEIGEE